MALGIASELGMVGAGVWWAGSLSQDRAQGVAVSGRRPLGFTQDQTALVTTHWIRWEPGSTRVYDVSRVTLPDWSFGWNLADNPRTQKDVVPEYIEIAYGWPWRSAHALLVRDGWGPPPRTTVRAISGIQLPSRRVVEPKYTFFLLRALPTSPIWSGLVAGIALFTLVWAALLLGVGRLRRWNRRRRGRCVECAYDLHATPQGLPCPECGLVRTRTGSAHPRVQQP